MKKIAQFQKVSLTQYKEDMKKNFNFDDNQLNSFYENILLPTRATIGSAGYDFKIPFCIEDR